ncbi:hypothetical protein PoB_006798400 [Plakobranchus ocellatus]|uniref:Uncharacterized protein n=1 Tax=Plakobranchus ocellatus TaxID=259542 RepID=A0AAV4DBA7_9GAST|nr:hypothetical protein PoB_006798400 [Plakobranchus ocellatus]
MKYWLQTIIIICDWNLVIYKSNDETAVSQPLAFIVCPSKPNASFRHESKPSYRCQPESLRSPCPQSPPSGQGARGGTRARDRRIPEDLTADFLSTVPPTGYMTHTKKDITNTTTADHVSIPVTTLLLSKHRDMFAK